MGALVPARIVIDGSLGPQTSLSSRLPTPGSRSTEVEVANILGMQPNGLTGVPWNPAAVRRHEVMWG